jgi:hypothetical protein
MTVGVRAMAVEALLLAMTVDICLSLQETELILFQYHAGQRPP